MVYTAEMWANITLAVYHSNMYVRLKTARSTSRACDEKNCPT